MNKKKALVCTIIFAIVIIGIFTACVFVKPHDSELSFFYIFSPVIVWHWVGERIGMFYKWLIKDN
jgi:hypothetical protein